MPSTGYDVIIIGGGGAGLAAAVSAAEQGAGKVLVLEKRVATGGNAARAWGLFAAASPVQKQEMVLAEPDRLFHLYMDWTHWKADPRLVRAFIDRSGDTIGWIEGMGVTMDLIRYYPGQEPPVWHVPQGRGAAMMQALLEHCKALGISIITNARGRQLHADAAGGITGVTAEIEGKEQFFAAGRVIVATGGFAGNETLLKRLVPEYTGTMQSFGLPHGGDGLLMAEAMGAGTESRGGLLLEWPHVRKDAGSLLVTIAREPSTLFVNRDGARFADETLGLHAFLAANAVLRQPEQAGFIITDAGFLWELEERGAVLGRGNDRSEKRRSMPDLPGHVEKLAAEPDAGVFLSGSWDEIAGWGGIAPEGLKNTVERYNSLCRNGRDEEFGKDREYLRPIETPPYCIIKGTPVFLHTIGGLIVNEKMEVLDRSGKPIAGLYAAGADTGGWTGDTYNDRFSGTALGYAINSGRIAGENALKS